MYNQALISRDKITFNVYNHLSISMLEYTYNQALISRDQISYYK